MSKSALREASTRNGIFLPVSKQIVTLDYMQGVRKGQYFCPKYGEIRLKPCPVPPTRNEINLELQNWANSKGLNLGFSGKNDILPEKQWMLSVLSTV